MAATSEEIQRGMVVEYRCENSIKRGNAKGSVPLLVDFI